MQKQINRCGSNSKFKRLQSKSYGDYFMKLFWKNQEKYLSISPKATLSCLIVVGG